MKLCTHPILDRCLKKKGGENLILLSKKGGSVLIFKKFDNSATEEDYQIGFSFASRELKRFKKEKTNADDCVI